MNAIDCRPWNKRNITTTLRDSTPSDALGYLFIPLGKAANTEVKRQLWELEHQAGSTVPVPEEYFAVHNYKWGGTKGEVETPWESYSGDDVDRLVGDLMNKYLFTVVRNPYTKLLSAYLDKIIKLQAKVAAGMPPEKYNGFNLPGVPQSFEAFVEMVCDQPDRDVDIHWAGQAYQDVLPLREI